ncbi:MAG: hypothetical protein LAO06_06840 [Acidobacteriia bacterium]|nr:hypothetical protein [Terriglobia bacterium]
MAAKAAAIGCRAHSGWAALVIVAGTVDAPKILERRRIVIADPKIPGSKQPYHAAEKLPFQQAEQLVARCTERSQALARQELRAAVEQARSSGHEVAGCGVLLASGRPLPDLAATLASHALIHTAEGELFRNVIAEASREMNVPVTGVKERELLARAYAALGKSDTELQRYLQERGRELGPPWTQDEKYATLAAWLALAATSGE